MNKIMTSKELCNKAIDIANNYKTLYVMGAFGCPLTPKNKARYSKNNAYNKQASRQKMINNASADTFGFDCVCLIKGILWGWNGDKTKTYGGSNYASNIGDITIKSMVGTKYSEKSSSDFSNIVAGELVYMKDYGHIGIYIGNGLAVECTPAWANKVQITAVGNIGKKDGYKTRTWDYHCKALFIDYIEDPIPAPVEKPYIEKGASYKLLYSKALRKKPCLGNNIVKVQNVDKISQTLSTKKSGDFYFKVGTIIDPREIITEKNGRVWASYGNCWWCLQNVDGKHNAERID